MRTLVKHGVVAVAILALVPACQGNQRPPPQTPAQHESASARAFNDPTVPRQTEGPMTNPPPLPETPREAMPPQPALEAPRGPMEDPRAQKAPFYGTGPTPTQGQAAAKTERPLSDPEVIGVAVAANEGEVQMADIALRKASAAEVKEFAGMMKTHHATALQKTKTVQTKTKLSSTPSELSTQLQTDATNMMKDLRDKTGTAFDKSYMDAQVKAHRDVLGAIDNRLIPSATNGELKTLITGMRRTVADHLGKAEEIQKKLGPAASMQDIPKAATPTAPANGKR